MYGVIECELWYNEFLQALCEARCILIARLQKCYAAGVPCLKGNCSMRQIAKWSGLWCSALGLLALGGCKPSDGKQEVVVYTALEFARPIFDDFEAEANIRVLPKWDTAATKTTGLVQAILAESNRPRCDVFWNNEILNTLRLEQKGLLEVYRPA